ncbi:hypothetical protein CP8484711_1235 [Chlamydia psittaci 84-8471/1]|nr:hypothetical protein CP8484711_1235 [Chlamydia psittaci 84-8471/1]
MRHQPRHSHHALSLVPNNLPPLSAFLQIIPHCSNRYFEHEKKISRNPP